MKRSLSKKNLPDSALTYVLESLVPYTDANLKLAFKPSLFFSDLENINRQKTWQRQKGRKVSQVKPYTATTLRTKYYHAKSQGYISLEKDGVPKLTRRAKDLIEPYNPKKLKKSTWLMVTFDIPEDNRHKRRYLRLLLKELEFTKVQQSVWVSKYDHSKILKAEIEEHNLREYVQVYWCARMI